LLQVDTLDLRAALAQVAGEPEVATDDFVAQAEMIARSIPYGRRLYRQLANALLVLD
jgi:hypothetical protein